MCYQRAAYKKGQLTPERIQRLDDLDFVWDVHQELWERGFSELASYKDANNHCLVPAGYKSASSFKLGSWVGTQRRSKDQLTPDRIQRLDDLDFFWDPFTEQWEQGFSELAIYRDANSHCLVPVTYKSASGFKLGSWIANQRTKKDQLTPDRIQRLNDLGFVWGPHTAKWKQGFSELASYKNANNDFRVPRRYKTASGFKLGSWVNTQRAAYKKGQLTPERIQRLDELGFVWKVNNTDG
tara:strand:+ start:178 stop:894 length:717 start_codon:yes stop_codon:yes gene_type:complete